MLVKTISQVTIPAGTLAIVPTIFNNTPKPNCYYSFTEISWKPQQNLFVAPGLNFFGKKLPLHLLYTIINTRPNDVILPRNQNIGEIITLNNGDDSWYPPSVNEVTHDISSDYINV